MRLVSMGMRTGVPRLALGHELVQIRFVSLLDRSVSLVQATTPSSTQL